MAATIATATGIDKSGRIKQERRLGSAYSIGQAATWRTFGVVHVNRDGSGFVEVKQNGELLGRITFGSENQPPAVKIEGRPR